MIRIAVSFALQTSTIEYKTNAQKVTSKELFSIYRCNHSTVSLSERMLAGFNTDRRLIESVLLERENDSDFTDN